MPPMSIATCSTWRIRAIGPRSSWRWRCALRRSGQDKEAKQILELLTSRRRKSMRERLFNLGEIARDGDDEDGFLRLSGPAAPDCADQSWLQRALLSGGKYLSSQARLRPGDRLLSRIAAAFPQASRAAYAHWKVAWLSFRQGSARRKPNRLIRAANRALPGIRPRFPRHCTGGPAWRKRTAIRRWRGPTIRKSLTASAITTTVNWPAAPGQTERRIGRCSALCAAGPCSADRCRDARW